MPIDEVQDALSTPDVWEEVRRSLESEQVADALQDLPAEQRESILLAFFGGYSYAEVARLTGTPPGTVKGRMRLGLKKLRVLLTDRQPKEGR
ncbi:MAG: sigK2 [Dehalococcoidia bacterium]|nr:sigK2 [Dehalococcoidia bacterium]